MAPVEPLTEAAIRGSFVNCSRGQARRLSLPGPLAGVDWPNLDFLGWRDPKAPGNAYLVLPRATGTIGIALRPADAAAGPRRSVCEFCRVVQGSADVMLFAAPRAGAAGKLGNTVGSYFCADLACGPRLRGKMPNTPPQPAESLTLDERIERMLTKLNAFIEEVLIDNH
jgi:hypothetical protein